MEESLSFLVSPKNIMVGNQVPFHMVFMCHSCFPVLIVNLSILNYFNNNDFSSFRVNWNIFVFKLLHVHTREIFPIQIKQDTFCLSAEQNRTNRVDWVRLVWLSSVIELTISINRARRKGPFRLCTITEPIEQQFDWLGSIVFDLFLVRFRSISYPGMYS